MKYHKTAEASGTLTGYKIADAVRSKTLATRAKSYDGKITKVSKSSPQNNSETLSNEHDKEIYKERYISPEEKKKLLIVLILI